MEKSKADLDSKMKKMVLFGILVIIIISVTLSVTLKSADASIEAFIDASLQGSAELASLEPPNQYTYLGFSINWYISEPEKISIDGKRPII